MGVEAVIAELLIEVEQEVRLGLQIIVREVEHQVDREEDHLILPPLLVSMKKNIYKKLKCA